MAAAHITRASLTCARTRARSPPTISAEEDSRKKRVCSAICMKTQRLQAMVRTLAGLWDPSSGKVYGYDLSRDVTRVIEGRVNGVLLANNRSCVLTNRSYINLKPPPSRRRPPRRRRRPPPPSPPPPPLFAHQLSPIPPRTLPFAALFPLHPCSSLVFFLLLLLPPYFVGPAPGAPSRAQLELLEARTGSWSSQRTDISPVNPKLSGSRPLTGL